MGWHSRLFKSDVGPFIALKRNIGPVNSPKKLFVR